MAPALSQALTGDLESASRQNKLMAMANGGSAGPTIINAPVQNTTNNKNESMVIMRTRNEENLLSDPLRI